MGDPGPDRPDPPRPGDPSKDSGDLVPGADGSSPPGDDRHGFEPGASQGDPGAEARTFEAGDVAAPARRPIFSLEGRAAPGLYAAGWLLTVLGLVLTFVALQATDVRGPAAIAMVIGGLGMTSIGLVAAAGAQALQRRADRVPGFAGASPFLVFAAAFAIINVVTLPLVLLGSRVGLAVDSPVAVVASLLINLAAYVVLIRLLVVGTGALAWSDMGLWRPAADPSRLASDLWSGAILAVPTVLATLVLAAILVQVMGAAPEPPLPPSRTAPGLLANLLAAAVIAPIGEELFFRGYATTAWARRIGPESALVRGALFFAFVHVLALSGSSFSEAIRIVGVTFVSRLPVAYLLGWLYLRRRSLYASIALHATFNGLLVVLSVLGG